MFAVETDQRDGMESLSIAQTSPMGSHVAQSKRAGTSQPWKARCMHVTSAPADVFINLARHPTFFAQISSKKKTPFYPLLKSRDLRLMLSVSEPPK